jgi:cytochrome c2
MKCQQAAALALCLLATAVPARPIELHSERSSPYDLALTGLIPGIPAGGTRYARWADLRALPTTMLTINGEFIAGPQTVTVVFLGDLWRALSPDPAADTLLATCSDGYTSVFTGGFMSMYRPFLVLEINGKGPEDWPPPGLSYNPGPYVITVSQRLVPDVAGFLDIEHKKPWGVTTLEAASFADRYKGAFSGKWAALPEGAKRGRDIWINSCASCHAGPAGTFSGTKAQRPFQVIAAYAGYDRIFFMRYVRDPKSLVASAKMEPHPDYTDAELSDLIAFITVGQQ